MKKVLFIHHGGIAGGAPLSMLYTMQGVRERGYNPIVGLLNPMAELHALYNDHGFETFNMPSIPVFITWSGSEGRSYNPIVWKNMFNAWLKWKKAKIELQEFIKNNKVDLVHLNSVSLSNPASLLTEMKFPFVWHVREHGPSRKGRRYKFIQKRLKEAKSVIFLSKAEQNSWIESNNHGLVVHNFINFEKFDTKIDVKNIASELGIKEGTKVLLYVGGSKKHKGIFPLIDSLKILKDKHKEDFVCLMPDTVIPKNPDSVQKRIQSMITNYGLEKECKLLPFSPNIVELFSICDILLFPATKPHFARPIIEGSAMKKPVIGSNLKAIDELIIDKKTGYLIPPNDPEILSEKIIELFNNPQLCREMGEAGYKFAKQEFEYNNQIDKIVKLYSKTLN